MMVNRFHRERLEEIITEFANTGRKADILLSRYFHDHRIGKRDRNILRALFYAFIRHRFTALLKRDAGLPLAEALAEIVEKGESAALEGTEFHAFPSWIEAALYACFGADRAYLAWLNGRAPTTLRINPQKTTREELAAELAASEVKTETSQLSPYGMIVTAEESRLKEHPAYLKGLFEFQDSSSQLAVLLINPGAKTLLDACAGGGGKTVAAASLFQNLAVTASDVRTRLFREIGLRADRAGVTVETAPLESLSGRRFDTVMIDAPCSGLGVLRRNPEDRWRIDEPNIGAFALLQRQCLSSYAPLVAKGGELVYITCSFTHEENEHQIEWFLEHNRDFRSIDAAQRLYAAGVTGSETLCKNKFLRVSPGGEGDLFFGAVLRRL